MKILEADGMIVDNGFNEYHLQPKGLRVLNTMEALGYLARHRVAAAETEGQEEEEQEGCDPFFLIVELFFGRYFFSI